MIKKETLINNKLKIFLINCFIILFSLSCDETEPTSVTNPELTYNITIQSQVRNCELVACLDDVSNEAYGTNVSCENECEDYHLYFQIKLLDSDSNPVENATLVIEECPTLPEEVSCSGEITTASFASFTGDNTTNTEGIIEGYWRDENEAGDFIITATYEDEYSNSSVATYPIFIRPMGELVDLLSVTVDAAEGVIEDNIYFINDEAESDSTNYAISIDARIIGDGVAIENAPVYFSLINDAVTSAPAPGFLDNASGLTDADGKCSATVNILDNTIPTKDSLMVLVTVLDTEIDSIMAQDTSKVLIYTNSYYKLEQTDELLVQIQNPFDDITNSYETQFSVKVISKTGARMPGVGVNFNATTPGVGSFDTNEAVTDTTSGALGDPAVVYFNVNPDEVETESDIVEVNFEISIADNNLLPDSHPLYAAEARTVTYSMSGNTDPEQDVAQFNFNPNINFSPHQTGLQTTFSVIALDEFGAPVQDATVYFSLDNGTGNSNGWISDYTVQTCCENNSDNDGEEEGDGGAETDGGIGDGGGDDSDASNSSDSNEPGIATVTYQNISGGSETLYASVRDPLNFTNIIAQDEILINTMNACPDCEEALTLKASHLTLSENQSSTNIYAFYTDSTGTPPPTGEFLTFSALKPKYCSEGECSGEENSENECLDCGGQWDEGSSEKVHVGGLSDENAIFVNGYVSEMPSNIFPNFDYCLDYSGENNDEACFDCGGVFNEDTHICSRDSSLIYATTKFSMGNTVGLVSIEAEYGDFTGDEAESIEILLTNTQATSIDFLDNEITKIYVQGGGQNTSAEIEISIKDGNGNIVNNCYTTKFELGFDAILKGVTFNGDSSEPQYIESEDGFPSVVIQSGQSPANVSITATLYDGCNLDTSNPDDLVAIASDWTDQIVVSSGAPSFGLIGYTFFEAENIGGGITQMPVSLMLWDTWGNEVPDDIGIYFSLDPPDLAYIISNAYTNNLSPTTQDSTKGVAWTTVQYNAAQLFQFPAITASVTGNACFDDENNLTSDPYDECLELGNDWLTNIPLTFSSTDNTVAYQNVCVDCTLSLVALDDIVHDYECANPDNKIRFRAQLLDSYGVPVEGARIQLQTLGSQGNPLIEAQVLQNTVFGCFNDQLGGTPGEYDVGTDILIGEEPDYTLGECKADEVNSCFFDINGNGQYDSFPSDEPIVELTQGECLNTEAMACYVDANDNDELDDGENDPIPGATEENCNGYGGIWGTLQNYTWGITQESENEWGVTQTEITLEDEMWIEDVAPYTDVTTNEYGYKYFRVDFSEQECIRTSVDPDVWTCSTPAVSALLLDPNSVSSDDINIIMNKTCP